MCVLPDNGKEKGTGMVLALFDLTGKSDQKYLYKRLTFIVFWCYGSRVSEGR